MLVVERRGLGASELDERNIAMTRLPGMVCVTSLRSRIQLLHNLHDLQKGEGEHVGEFPATDPMIIIAVREPRYVFCLTSTCQGWTYNDWVKRVLKRGDLVHVNCGDFDMCVLDDDGTHVRVTWLATDGERQFDRFDKRLIRRVGCVSPLN